ncbi:MAG: T9SS type A sorting domain-containing protein [Chitinophagaceae bacterium]|nr:T9SS type A sorting domain-containing protein [Chitinophagaceae bacterium]
MRYLTLAALLLSSATLSAQQSFTITPGASVTIVGNVPITLNNVNFVNNGTFTAGTGTIALTGSTASTIGGTGTGNFYNLTINNTGGVNLLNNIGVDNQLDMSGMLNVKNRAITLSPTAVIVNEANATRVTDDAANTGNVTTTRTFSSPLANINPANIGVEFVSSPALGNTTITRIATAFVLNGSSTGLIQRYYNIQPANNTGLNASVRFYYLDAELNGVLENTAVLWKSTNNGVSWVQIAPDSRNTTANWVQKDNVNDFSLWTVGNNNSALPIILSAFNSYCKDNGANLIWKTEYEMNSEKFIIEKSKDAVNWNAIGTIDAKGNPSDYNFTDAEAGKVYYRLKQIDKDGSFTYSKILASDCEVKSITLMLYPNPASDYTELVFSSKKAFSTNIQIFDAAGKMVQNIQAGVQTGMNKIRLNLAALAGGTYIVKLNDEGLNITKTFVKQ